MSTRVSLQFSSVPHPSFDPLGIPVTRVIASLRFRHLTGEWTGRVRAIVDTGSPITILPPFIWTQLAHRVLRAEPEAIGLGGRTVGVTLAEIEAIAVDTQQASAPFQLRAFLCQDDSDLAVVGMQDFLMRGVLHLDHATRTAYLDLP